jgi:hypothetical protein
MKLKERLYEPSTWAGLGMVVSNVGDVVANPKDMQAWTVLLFGLIAIIKREGAAPSPAPVPSQHG